MTRPIDTGKTTKSVTLQKLLRGRSGASLDRLCQATGWQPHSVRAALSRLRKAGYTVERREPAKPGGEARYRITAMPGSAS